MSTPCKPMWISWKALQQRERALRIHAVQVWYSNKLPRGIRNNNPLNIRIGSKWKGEVETPSDREFEQFTCMHYGLRAGFLILRRYIERYHIDTVKEIISRWAPQSENSTSRYVSVVSERMSISPLEKISFSDRKIMVALVDAMILVECGTTISNDLIEDAYTIVINNDYSWNSIGNLFCWS